ncbi:phasin family protein [Sphingomonas sp. PL-96]|uniref:phasin family protein n=1 Tax=Sphingomonas sp. PL-96 TaxID=2887201 RepID=UPI001E414EC2|nr:phasin family protein [Sphingomonas sp. PL-96]MCC2976136.1 phasin family protein [Sphingomonas sp. PL-96]
MAEENSGNDTNETGSAAGASGSGGATSGGGSQAGGFAGGSAGMADGLRAAGERMREAGGQIAGQGSELGLRMLDQAETNTREAFRMMRAAAQAKDMTDVMRLQSEYMREQSNRSIAQAREIGELIASFGRSTIGQMTGKS